MIFQWKPVKRQWHLLCSFRGSNISPLSYNCMQQVPPSLALIASADQAHPTCLAILCRIEAKRHSQQWLKPMTKTHSFERNTKIMQRYLVESFCSCGLHLPSHSAILSMVTSNHWLSAYISKSAFLNKASLVVAVVEKRWDLVHLQTLRHFRS